MTDAIEFDLREVLRFLLKRVWIITLCAVIAGAGALVYTMKFVQPQYKASVSMYVNNNSGKDNDYISSGDLAVALRLVETYVNIIQSNSVLEQVAEEAQLNLTAGQIRSMISASAVGETEMFKVAVTSTDPQLAADIANAIAKVAPEKISAIIEGSNAKIIDYAKVPSNPTGPDYTKNTITGFVCGLALSLLLVAVVHLADNRIKNERELRQIFTIPVLGRIPNFEEEAKRIEAESRR